MRKSSAPGLPPCVSKLVRSSLGSPTRKLLHMTRVVTITADLEPDQQPRRWDDHVALYEDVFERLTQGFSDAAIEALAPKRQSHVLDSGAGTGGAALELARRGHSVTAIDASMAMVARIRDRASAAGLTIEALTMDG